MSQERKLSLAMYSAALAMEMSAFCLILMTLREAAGFSYATVALVLVLYPVPFLFRMFLGRALFSTKRGIILGIAIVLGVIAMTTALAFWQVANSGLPAGEGTIMGIAFQAGLCALSLWLGNSLVSREMTYQYLCLRFQGSFLAMLLFTMAIGQVFVLGLLYFIAAMAALSLARWEVTASGATGVLHGFRVRSAVASGLAIVLPATAVFFILSPQASRALVNGIGAFINLILHLLGLDRLPPTPGQAVDLNLSCACQGSPEEESSAPPATPTEGSSPSISHVFLWIVVFFALLTIVLFVIWLVKKLLSLRLAQRAGIEGVEAIAVPVSLFGEIKAFFHNLLARLRRFLLHIFGRRQRRQKGTADPEGGGLSIRLLYRNLLWWAARRGLPRLPWQTPQEYLSAARTKFPQKEQGISLLTGVYQKARYSSMPPDALDEEAANKAWDDINTDDRPA